MDLTVIVTQQLDDHSLCTVLLCDFFEWHSVLYLLAV
jgi:hypothetical protein